MSYVSEGISYNGLTSEQEAERDTGDEIGKQSIKDWLTKLGFLSITSLTNFKPFFDVLYNIYFLQ